MKQTPPRTRMTYRLGLIINPIAGMGGSVGLKGTDGALAARARALGAAPVAARRAVTAFGPLAELAERLEILTGSGDLGEKAATEQGFRVSIVHVGRIETSAADTRATARAILERDPALLLVVGGDGTARDVLEVIGDKIPILGVPAGVKMHSAIYAATPRAAGEVAYRFLLAADREALLEDAEIMDREILSTGEISLSPKLFGIVRSPKLGFLVPGAKSSSRVTERAALEAAVLRAADAIDDPRISLIGPGSTMQALKRRLGFEGTSLGVDAVERGRLIAEDLNENRILELIEDRPARIVVSVVGGQGFLFGRGNQQLSARVIRAVGIDNVVIVASLDKLSTLAHGCLLVDTGDEALDEDLAGHVRVIVSGKRTVMMPVKNASRVVETR